MGNELTAQPAAQPRVPVPARSGAAARLAQHTQLGRNDR